MIKTSNFSTDHTHRVLTRLLCAANGGTDPAMIKLSVSTDGGMPADAEDHVDRRTRLHVTIDSDGRLSAAVGVALNWKMLWSEGLRFCIAPSGQLFLQSTGGALIYCWVEDDRLLMDRGSLVPTVTQQRVAMAAFDTDFAAMLMEAL